MVAGAVGIVSVKKRFEVTLAKRKTLVETFYIDCLNTGVCLELALNEDLPLVADYLRIQYGDQKLDNAFKSDESLTIIARDGVCICGVLIGSVIHYGIDYDKENMLDASFKDLPPNTERFFHINWLNVDEAYRKSGLGTRLWIECLKLAISTKCQYVTSSCSLDIAVVIATKFGMRLINKDSVESNFESKWKNFLMLYDLNDATELIAKNSIPQIPEAYRLRQTKRPLIHSTFVKHLEREIKFEIAVPGDEQVIHNYAVNEFFKQTPLFVTLGFRREDSIELAKTRISPELIADGRVLLVTDKSYLVGFAICRNVEVDRRKPKYDLLSNDLIDLTEEIDKMTELSMPIAKYRASIGLINAQMSFCVPEHVENFCVLQMGHLFWSYRHHKLGFELGSAALMLAYQKKHRFIHNLTTSIASQRQTQASGAKTVFDCPCNKFLYNGKLIFPEGQLSDGHSAAKVFQMDLNEL